MHEVPAVPPHPSVIVETAIKAQEGNAKITGLFVARLLEQEFHGRGGTVVLEGEVRISATVRDRKTGEMLGKAELAVPLSVAEEYQPPTDTDTLEVNPGEAL